MKDSRNSRQWHNSIAVTPRMEGDQELCTQWLGYAKAQLRQLLTSDSPLSLHLNPAPGVEIYVRSRPNGIEISAGGGILYAVGINYWSMLGIDDGHPIDGLTGPEVFYEFPKQLVIDTITNKLSPLRFSRAQTSFLNGSPSLAIGSNGFLYTFGLNILDELDSFSEGSVPFKELRNPTKITSAGRYFSEISAGFGTYYAINKKGEMYSWGNDSYGKLGIGSAYPGGSNMRSLQFVGNNYKKVSARSSYYHAVALSTSGHVLVCGGGFLPGNDLGLGSVTNTNGSFVSIFSDCKDVEAGYMKTYFIKNNNDLYGCGGYDGGSIGTTLGYSDTPVFIGSDFQRVSAGYAGTLGVKKNGDLYVWGHNYALPGPGYMSNIPHKIAEGFADICSGSFIDFALKKNGDLYGWGYNEFGTLGIGATPYPYIVSSPTLITKNVKHIDATNIYATLIIK